MKTIHRVVLKNFLSFREVDINLSELNVLVGPNGSGKTNLLRAFQFIGELARTDLPPAIRRFGGHDDLIFRGKKRGQWTHIEFEGVMTDNASLNAMDNYILEFRFSELRSTRSRRKKVRSVSRYISRRETIVLKRKKGRGRRITLRGAELRFESTAGPKSNAIVSSVPEMKVGKETSGLALLRRLGDQHKAPQVEQLATIFESIRLYDVNVEAIRRPTQIVNPQSLEDNGSNVAEYLYWMKEIHPHLFHLVEEDVKHVLPGFKNFVFEYIGGSDNAIRMDIQEYHLAGTTPLARTSFGTIRAIALFAMLHDPNPPKLTCLEEIDHGLHPNALDRLVQRLREASERTQILVATHSPAFVNRLRAEELIILEKDPDGGYTRVPDVSNDEILEMEKESGLGLGELWFSGILGG